MATPFPLGKTGGLIEAPNCTAGGTIGAEGFRWVKPAASLKHGWVSIEPHKKIIVSAG